MRRAQRIARLSAECRYHVRDVTFAFEILSAFGAGDVSIEGVVRACRLTGRPIRATVLELSRGMLKLGSRKKF